MSSTWQVKLLKNFQEDVLAGNSTLIVSLAARGPQTFATAVLAIQLPDKNDIAFSALSYVAEYVLDGSPHVVLETEIETSQAEYSQIVLHSEFCSEQLLFESKAFLQASPSTLSCAWRRTPIGVFR